MTNAILEPPEAKIKAAATDLVLPLQEPGLRPGSRSLSAAILVLTLGVFIADLETPERYHIGILYNVCIALTLWSWQSRWVIGTTIVTVILRIIGHGMEIGFFGEALFSVDMFNLIVGLAVQALTGGLIWRQVVVQHRLEAGERQVHLQARELAGALIQAQEATREAQDATLREREARLREVEARRREHKTLQSLERVQNLSAALSRAVLPIVPTEIAGGRISLSARYAPAERDIQIGGDFYDVIGLNESQTRYALVIGDVAGHGVEAAAQTALVTSTLRTCAFEDENGPANVLSRTARTLEGQLDSFVSLFYGVYDADAQTLTYASAGHEPPILTLGEDVIPLKPTGPILGVGLSEFGEVELPLRSGQTLVFLTDGLTEVRRGPREMLDWEGIAAIIARQAEDSCDAAEIADGILGDVWEWAGRTRLADDVALLVVCVK